MSEPVQGWVQTVTPLSETQPYEKIVRLKLCVRTSTRDKTSRLDHYEDMLEMVPAEPIPVISIQLLAVIKVEKTIGPGSPQNKLDCRPERRGVGRIPGRTIC
jgi:hypothetical protein